jgi:hypothetical protein
MEPNYFCIKDVFKTHGRPPHALTDDQIKKIQNTVQPWPPNAQPNGSFIVTSDYSVFSFDYVKLPDGFTLQLADDVDQISWTIGLFEFGQEASFFVNAPPQTEPYPIPAPQPAIPGKAQPHQKGASGLPGINGQKGPNGRPLELTIANMVVAGSLWIRTDGGSGGPGGSGGKGQTGGDNGCDGPNNCNGGDGGDGGDAGKAGAGGDTSAVKIIINSLPTGYVQQPVACPPGGAAVTGIPPRPSNASGNDGRIVIWGTCGLGCSLIFHQYPWPKPGIGGDPGGGNTVLECRDFPWTNYNAFPGNRGRGGKMAQMGDFGTCSPTVIMGPTGWQIKDGRPKSSLENSQSRSPIPKTRRKKSTR